MGGRKRKADDELVDATADRMSSSPSPSPALNQRLSPSRPRQYKRPKTNLAGRPLPLPRLLETLNPDQLRSVLRTICDQHPDIGSEIASTAPRPTVQSTLDVLNNYQTLYQRSFPYGDRPTSDYAYNRVRASLLNLLDALKDFTPQFLPPMETQPATALAFLDSATNIIHSIPQWDNYQYLRHKEEAYDEIAKAWALVIREAAKKGGGIQLQYAGWDEKLAKHNQLSSNRLQEAVSELRSSLGWIDGAATGLNSGDAAGDVMSIRQQLLSNTYGSNNPIQVGPW